PRPAAPAPHSPAPPLPYTLSLHDALPISSQWTDCAAGGGHRSGAEPDRVAPRRPPELPGPASQRGGPLAGPPGRAAAPAGQSESDRKSTRLNSSHVSISYAVFCLKTKTAG